MARDEEALLEAAKGGRQDAFAELVEPYQSPLRAHCYRMLGALPDAEEAVQDTLLRAWRSLGRFEGRSSFRSWLYTIATNASLRLIEKRPRRVLPVDFGSGDPRESAEGPVAWLDPYPDGGWGAELSRAEGPAIGPDAVYEQRESVELAFTAALQYLPARQRATLILRDVLGFSARDVAELLETTPASVDSTMQRARKTVHDRIPALTQQTTLRALGDSSVREIVDRFAAAWENHDVDALVTMLADDARLAMPPEAGWFQGRGPIADFLRSRPLSASTHFRLVVTSANAQPALAAYQWDEHAGAYLAESIIVLSLAGETITGITAFRDPTLFDRFGLPARSPDAAG